MDNFDAYKLPLGMTEGVLIKLAGTKAEFLVQLPGRSNEDFTLRLLSRMTAKGNVRQEGVNVIEMQVERKALFLEENVLKATGLPGDMSVGDFFAQYPLAGKVLFERAQELALEADEQVEAAMEKLSPTPSGQHSGKESMTNTTKSSPQGSSPAPKGQKSAA